jgi:hypothetical protein
MLRLKKEKRNKREKDVQDVEAEFLSMGAQSLPPNPC